MKKVNFEYKAKINKVIDGDTIDVVINLGFKHNYVSANQVCKHRYA